MNFKNKKLMVTSLSLALLLTACGTAGNGSSADSAAGNMSSMEASAPATSESMEAATSPAQTGKIQVIAASDPIYEFVTAIGGDRVEVTDLIEGEAHDWEPTPVLLGQINEANLFLVSGAGMETWLPSVQNSITGDVKILDMSEGVETHELAPGQAVHDHDHDDADDHDHEEAEEHSDEHADEHDHDDADDHAEEHEDEHDHDHEHAAGGVDPHYWLSPTKAQQQAENVYKALVAADPDGKDVYDANWKALQEKFATLQKNYDEQLKPFAGRSVIVPHEAFAYMFENYDLKQVGLEGVFAEGDPTAQKVAQIVDQAKADGIKTVFFEGYDDPEEAKAVADEIGANTAPLYTLEVISKEDRQAGVGYFELMQKNLEALVASFEK